MLSRFNKLSRNKLSLPGAHIDSLFQGFILEYLDGAMSQCSAIYTGSGFPVGFRSDEVGLANGVWHVPGGYLPGISQGIYKSEVPVVDGRPIVSKMTFTPDAESLKANALVNLYKESGRMLMPSNAEISYIGIIYELPFHGVQFVSVVETGLKSFGMNWEHDKMMHCKPEDVPALLNRPDMIAGSMLRGGQACLAVAYLREKGFERTREFTFLSQG